MAKRKKTITAGCIVKTILYTAPQPRDGERVRAVKSRMTTAAQKAMNDKTARGRLELLMAANFTGRDLFITLTYRDADLPTHRREAIATIRKFLRDMRTLRKKKGQDFRYIYTTENKHGAGRLHHHLVINATERDIEALRSLWSHGDVVDLKYVGSRGYDILAVYMTKESAEERPVGAQMWTASRNLKKPVVETSFVPDDETLTVPLGCHVMEREEKATEYGAYCYIKYRVLPRTPAGRKTPMEEDLEPVNEAFISC